jgi:uncharacterized membrane protein (TIGR02234 family)
MAVAGGVLGWSGIRALTGSLGSAVDDGRVLGTTTADVATAWPLVAGTAGLLGIAAGLLVVLRGRGWPAMGRRYERPSGAGARTAGRPARPLTDDDRAQDAWKAMDRGEDPTDPAPAGGSAP